MLACLIHLVARLRIYEYSNIIPTRRRRCVFAGGVVEDGGAGESRDVVGSEIDGTAQLAPLAAVRPDATHPIRQDLVRGELTHRPLDVPGIGLPVPLPHGETRPVERFADAVRSVVQFVTIVAKMLAGGKVIPTSGKSARVPEGGTKEEGGRRRGKKEEKEREKKRE